MTGFLARWWFGVGQPAKRGTTPGTRSPSKQGDQGKQLRVVKGVSPKSNPRPAVHQGAANDTPLNEKILAKPIPTSEIKSVNDISELPTYTQVLTGQGGEFAFNQSNSACKVVCAVKTGPMSAAIILNGDAAKGTSEHLSLKTNLRHADVTITGQFIVSNVLFSQIAIQNGAKGDEALNLNESEGAKIFDMVATRAVEWNATDIHVFINEHDVEVKFRVNALLHKAMTLTPHEAHQAMGVAYNKLAIEASRSTKQPQYSREQSQYCMIARTIDGKPWRIRYQSTKCEGGLKVVLRLLRGEALTASKTLEDLGYELSQVRLFKLSTKKKGATFIAGETGSGKSTTLTTLIMNEVDRVHEATYTVEDPVENRMQDVVHIPVQRDTATENDSAGFSEALRILLRADPDNIMLGEIRDKVTADIFAPAVLSGHRCFTTVHTSSGIGIITRLATEPINMPLHILTSKNFISALVYQELLPTLCPKCSLPADQVLDPGFIQKIQTKFEVDTSKMRAYRNDAETFQCENPKCLHGVAGQTVAAEVIMPDMKLLQLIREKKEFEAEQYWRNGRIKGFNDPDMTGKTAFEHGLYKVLQGKVDIRHLEKFFESVSTYEVVEKA